MMIIIPSSSLVRRGRPHNSNSNNNQRKRKRKRKHKHHQHQHQHHHKINKMNQINKYNHEYIHDGLFLALPPISPPRPRTTHIANA